MSPHPTGFSYSLLLLVVLLAACSPVARDRSPSNPTAAEKARPLVAEAALAVAKQKYIWDIEHTAFELEKKFGSKLTAALRAHDAEAIQRFCRPAFAAQLPGSSRESRLDRGYVRQFQTDMSAKESTHADASRFSSYLCSYFSDFSEIDRVTCRVLQLDADDKQPASGRWSVTLYLAGSGKNSQGALLEFVSEHQLRCTFLDDKAIEVATILDDWKVRSEEFRQLDRPLFEEATVSSGLDKVDLQDNWTVKPDRVSQYHSQMAVEDFDRDGFLDLAVASSNGRWRLLRSVQGERFVEVTQERGLPLWADEEPRSRSLYDQAFVATWIDFDNDHYPDLLLGDRLFRNLAGQRFEDVTDRSGLILGYNPKGCVVADYDCDGRLDLYVLYQSPRVRRSDVSASWVGDDESGELNDLWKNVGDGHFVNVTERAGAGGGRRQSFAAAWLYANEDHFPDLYVANDFGRNSLLLNRGDGTFTDIAESSHVSDYSTSMGVAAGDVTGDGLPEIYVANMFSKMGRRIIAHVSPGDYPAGVYQQIQGACAGNRLYSPTGSGPGTYRDISEAAGVNQVGWAYAPALADFDSDGWLDIYATCGFLSFRRDLPDG